MLYSAVTSSVAQRLALCTRQKRVIQQCLLLEPDDKKTVLEPYASMTAAMLSPVVANCRKHDPQLAYGMGWYVRPGEEVIPYCLAVTPCSLLRPPPPPPPPPIFEITVKGSITRPTRGPLEPVSVLHVYASCKCRRVVFVYQACRK